MVARVVIGANYGDEGKGTVVAHYTKHAEGPVLNVLTNGGPQRAHSILTEEGSFTFQHFGSGTYYGADNYLSEFFIINPFVFVDEYKRLTDKGVKVSKVYRNPRCRWSTPWDMMANRIKEELRGDKKHGSCGMGIWETVLRYHKTVTILFDDFMAADNEHRINYLKKIRKYYTDHLDIPQSWRDVFYSDNIIYNFIADCEIFNKITSVLLLAECTGYSEMILENGQGLLLSDTGKDIPGTTPSWTGFGYARKLLTEVNFSEVSTHYVTRPYLTRHGKGELAKEQHRKHISGDVNIDRTNHYNILQDEFRYAPLEISSLKERIDKDRGINPVLEITHCDEMDRTAEFRTMFNRINTFDSALIK